MEVTTIAIELTFNGQTNNVQLALSPSEENWNSLEKQCREQFGLNEGSLKIKYQDEEGDSVSIDSNEELSELLNRRKEGSLRFQVVLINKRGRCRRSPEARPHLRAENQAKKEERIKAQQERRNERMLKKFGKILTKEELTQMREERIKKQQERKNERMLKQFGKILTTEELAQVREERLKKQQDKMLRAFGKILTKEEKLQLLEERRKQRMLKKFGKILTKEEMHQVREQRKKQKASLEMPKEKKRCDKPLLSKEERQKIQKERRDQRMIARFGKILTEEERKQLREARMKKRAERKAAVEPGVKILTEEERLKLREARMKKHQQRKKDVPTECKANPQGLTKEERQKIQKERRDQRMIARFGKILTEEETKQLREARMKKCAERKALSTNAVPEVEGAGVFAKKGCRAGRRSLLSLEEKKALREQRKQQRLIARQARKAN